MGNITQLLDSHREGVPDALDRLLEEIYPQVRGLARGLLRRESGAVTLQPTALAHEFLLSLMNGAGRKLTNRSHLMAIAALQMRHLVARHAVKRRARVAEFVEETARGRDDAPDRALALTIENALEQLEEFDPRACRVVVLKFFGGMGMEEIARELGVTSKTVQRDWTFASAWLSMRIGGK